jgi:hypothetical protein
MMSSESEAYFIGYRPVEGFGVTLRNGLIPEIVEVSLNSVGHPLREHMAIGNLGDRRTVDEKRLECRVLL